MVEKYHGGVSSSPYHGAFSKKSKTRQLMSSIPPTHSRRKMLTTSIMTGLSFLLISGISSAKQFLTPAQAKSLLIGKAKATKIDIKLTTAQAKQIKKLSKVRVRHKNLNAYKTAAAEWLIFDQVIGKHENIDVAFALTNEGKVKGIEILVYRETYGHEIRNINWRNQFFGRGHEKHLQLDQEIKNISGATLSCSHITDAVNRITQTWALVLSKK